ncbi:hypothetical protein DUNSADRAFT_12744 [Dunaliella salina]|uniref:Encoded protein n=1 Tax=Dunaliella salina TaxID=3046 RepID=A0ABQ7FRI6_DUNSA|nr:hypothetical protein DUNSADRAFT_12744 [Dunaliella salina]|eukprot:KAF5825260.1 hypothetical protein DUNSADRAFT_12744 [Dunaliella salina]
MHEVPRKTHLTPTFPCNKRLNILLNSLCNRPTSEFNNSTWETTKKTGKEHPRARTPLLELRHWAAMARPSSTSSAPGRCCLP